MTMPRANRKPSTFLSDSGYSTFTIATNRMTTGDALE